MVRRKVGAMRLGRGIASLCAYLAVACGGPSSPAPTATAQALCAPPKCAVSDISAGMGFSCGLLSDGMVACWGDDTIGQRSF